MAPVVKSTAKATNPGITKKNNPIPSIIATPGSILPEVWPLRSGYNNVPHPITCNVSVPISKPVNNFFKKVLFLILNLLYIACVFIGIWAESSALDLCNFLSVVKTLKAKTPGHLWLFISDNFSRFLRYTSFAWNHIDYQLYSFVKEIFMCWWTLEKHIIGRNQWEIILHMPNIATS